MLRNICIMANFFWVKFIILKQYDSESFHTIVHTLHIVNDDMLQLNKLQWPQTRTLRFQLQKYTRYNSKTFHVVLLTKYFVIEDMHSLFRNRIIKKMHS